MAKILAKFNSLNQKQLIKLRHTLDFYHEELDGLDSKYEERIEQKLLETTKYQTIEGIYQVDADLIGGLVIRIADTVVDSSLKTQIANLSKTLL